jgi:hypothetical protein
MATREVRIARAFALAHDIDRLWPPLEGYPTRAETAERIAIALTRELLDAAQEFETMQLSNHFSLAEMTASEVATRKGLDNTPPPDVIENLKLLCVYLERVRDLLSAPLIVHSGYRSVKVNTAVGGSPSSAHTKGLACDFIAPEFGTPQEVCKMILESNIAYDQLIFEQSWTHFAIGDNMRKLVLTAHFESGKAIYSPGIT